MFEEILQSPEMAALIDLIVKAVFSTLGIFIVTLVKQARAALEAKTSKEQVQTIESIAKMAVRFIEQTMKQSGNDVKLQSAFEEARRELESKNIRIGDKALTTYIEAAVNTVKKEVAGGAVPKIETTHEVNIDEFVTDALKADTITTPEINAHEVTIEG